MLKLFEVEGFKNFHEKITLDFSDVRGYQFNEHCVKDGLLKTGIVYGKNSSGKTNLSLALFDVAQHFADKDDYSHRYENYLNNKILAQFRYVFQFGEDIIDYRYEKSTHKTLAYEYLTVNDVLYVDKRYDSSDFGNLLGLQDFAPTLNFDFFSEGSIIKYALKNTKGKDDHVLYKMMQYILGITWFKAYDESGITTEPFHKLFADDPELIKPFQSLLSMAGVRDKLSLETDVDGIKRLYSAQSNYSEKRIPFFKATSSGTISLFTFFIVYLNLKETHGHKISLLLYDEFDAYYHFELAEAIVRMLGQVPETQVIITSHNTNLMTNMLMRPDCLFILTPEKLTSFANATIMELREGHNLEKLYMGGEFNVK